VGFDRIETEGRRPFGLAELTRYPLFAPEFLDFLRRVMPPQRHAELVFALVVTARKPEAAREAEGRPQER
jgi:hypothetical protein